MGSLPPSPALGSPDEPTWHLLICPQETGRGASREARPGWTQPHPSHWVQGGTGHTWRWLASPVVTSWPPVVDALLTTWPSALCAGVGQRLRGAVSLPSSADHPPAGSPSRTSSFPQPYTEPWELPPQASYGVCPWWAGLAVPAPQSRVHRRPPQQQAQTSRPGIFRVQGGRGRR